MKLLREIGNTLAKMFVGDVWLAAGVVVVATLTDLLIESAVVSALSGGAVLFLGCIALLSGSVALHARRNR